jgi:catechol 1,2-dioxygenase
VSGTVVTPAEITADTLRRFRDTPDARLKELMLALTRHLHAFIVEVGLTEDEWQSAIRILTETGHITDEQRQEFILWSDTLGVSMLVDAVAHPTLDGATEPTILGPFYVPGAPRRARGQNIAEEPAGTVAWIHGRVVGLDGAPVAGAEIDVWQNGDDMLYAVQRTDCSESHLRGRFTTAADGTFAFQAVRPVPYPIPDDGPVGRMLAATARHPWRPAHVHLIVRADGFRSVTTHIFDRHSAYLDDDTVMAVKTSLIRDFQERSAEDPDRPDGVTQPWVSLELEIVLAPGTDQQEIVDRGRTH